MGRAAPCNSCLRLRLRLFLTLALPLVALIYLQPEAAVRLAAWLPAPAIIGGAIMAVGMAGFALKLRAWRNGRDI